MSASSCQEFAFPKPPRREKVKRAKVKAEDKHERIVYAAVDRRDKLRCRVTGRQGDPYSTSLLDKLHHHHILQKGRDLGPTETWNVISLHASTHSALHDNELTIEGSADPNEEWPLRIGLKASAAESLFGKGRRVPAHITVIDVEDWVAWLDDHAARLTRKWIEKVGALAKVAPGEIEED